MKFLRLLLCLCVAVVFVAPPVAAQSTPSAHHETGDCPHHGDKSGRDAAKQMAHGCCPSMNCGYAVVSVVEIEPTVHFVDRSLQAELVLHGHVTAKDPPPPRV